MDSLDKYRAGEGRFKVGKFVTIETVAAAGEFAIFSDIVHVILSSGLVTVVYFVAHAYTIKGGVGSLSSTERRWRGPAKRNRAR